MLHLILVRLNVDIKSKIFSTNTDVLELLDRMKITEMVDFEVEFHLDKYYTGNMMYDFVSPRNTSKVHVVLNNDVREMKADIVNQISKLPQVIENKDELKEVKAYFVNVILYSEWATKKYKSLKKIDLTNIYKPVEDAIMEALGMDDSLCVEERLSKAQCNEDNKGLVEVKFILFR